MHKARWRIPLVPHLNAVVREDDAFQCGFSMCNDLGWMQHRFHTLLRFLLDCVSGLFAKLDSRVSRHRFRAVGAVLLDDDIAVPEIVLFAVMVLKDLISYSFGEIVDVSA